MKYPLIALPMSTLLVLTGCGGSSSGGDDAAKSTAPTVTVTAPATAVTTIAYNVAWTSTDATSCSSAFSASTATSGSEAVTATEAGTATYSVTCTGAGGTATGTANVAVSEIGNAQGLWQGDTTGNGGNRTFGGVITDTNQYWLVYNGTDAAAGDPAGFFVGTGTTVTTSSTEGTFTGNGMIEFNFEGDGSAVGTLATDYIDKTSLSGTATSTISNLQGKQTYTIDGITDDPTTVFVSNPDPVTFTDGGTPWVITTSGTPSIVGQLHFVDYDIHLEINIGPATVDVVYPGRVLTIAQGSTYQANLDTTNPLAPKLLLTGVEFQDSVTSPGCTDSSGIGTFCAFIPTSTPYGDIELTFNATMDKYTGVAHAFQPVDGLPQDPDSTCLLDTYTVPTNSGTPNQNPCATATLRFKGRVSNLPATEVTQTITSTYNAIYETAGSLAAIAGDYVGNAGLEAALDANSTLAISSSGAITGTTVTTECAITGALAPHGNKNVYDVTNLVFTDAGVSNACPLVGETLQGVATYDADSGKITVTATTDDKSQGFLFVGPRAP